MRSEALKVQRAMAIAGLLTGPIFGAALVAFASPLPNYRHADHPPAVLGALGYPGSMAWNVTGYMLVGVLAALASQGLYRALRTDAAGALARIGATVLLLSAVAFAAQGIFPLDLQQPIDIGPSRIHVAVWNLWWLAGVAGMLLTGMGTRKLNGWCSLLTAGVLAAMLMLGALNTELGGLGDGWRQRIALAAWFGWLAWTSLLVLRGTRPGPTVTRQP